MIFSIAQNRQPVPEIQNSGGCIIHLRPEEEDLQDLYENNNYHKPLDPNDFSVDRGWWYRCQICGGQTRLRTRHPYCRHCGFSQSTKGKKEVA